MKILIATKFGQLAPLAVRFTREGHEVGLLIVPDKKTDKEYLKIYDGLVWKFKSEREAFNWNPELVICAEGGMNDVDEYFRSRELPIIGRTEFQEELEEKRFDALDLAYANGADVPFTIQMHDVGEAKKFLESEERRFIVKYEGDDDSSHSFMGRQNEDIANFIVKHPPKHGFILQEFCKGDEYNCELWFCEGKPIFSSLNFAVEQKKFLPGDMGINTGCESTIVMPGDVNSKLFHAYKAALAIANDYSYTGPIDMALIHHENRYLFIEFTPRFGINAVYAWLELVKSNFGDWLYDIATGEASELQIKDGFGFALTLSIPPYPYDAHKYTISDEVIRVPEIPGVQFFPYDVRLENGELITVGSENIVGYLTTFGETYETAIKQALEAAEEVKDETSGIQYRIDAGAQKDRLGGLLHDSEERDDVSKLPIEEENESTSPTEQEHRAE